MAAVEGLGYRVARAAPAPAGEPVAFLGAPDRDRRRLRRISAVGAASRSPRVPCGTGSIWAAVLALPVVALSMIPALAVRRVGVAVVLVLAPRWCCGAPGRSTGRRWSTCATGDHHGHAGVAGRLAAYGWSVYALFWAPPVCRAATWAAGRAARPTWRWPPASPVFVLAGRYAEARATRRAGAAIEALADLGRQGRGRGRRRGPRASASRSTSWPWACGSWCARVRRWRPTAWSSRARRRVDRSLLTGESVPVEVGPGDTVMGATVNAGGRLVVEATGVGADTALAQIARLVEAPRPARRRCSGWPTGSRRGSSPPSWSLAAATLAVWLVTGQEATEAFAAAVAVLIVACPCALGLATPTGAAGGDRPRRPARRC